MISSAILLFLLVQSDTEKINEFISKFKNDNAIALIEKNKNLAYIKDKHSMAPLHVACKFENIEMVKYLINNGARINAESINKLTPIYFTENEEIVKLLIQNGAQTNIVDSFGDTPLQYAAMTGKSKLLKSLLNNGVKKDPRTAAYIGDINYFKIEVKNNPELLSFETTGKSISGCKTPVGISVEKNNIILTKEIIKSGFSINEGNESFKTGCYAYPLSSAVWANNFEMTKILLESGADVDIPGGFEFATITDYAKKNCDTKIVKILIEYSKIKK